MLRDSMGTVKASTKERRKSSRIKILRAGTIVYGADSRTIDCVLLDISDGGAKLAPIDIDTCPDTFFLEFADHPARHCQVIWREYRHMGVKFE